MKGVNEGSCQEILEKAKSGKLAEMFYDKGFVEKPSDSDDEMKR
jgi:hypothetical protein